MRIPYKYVFGFIILVLVLSCLSSTVVCAEEPHKYISVSAGYDFLLALRDDGTVWTWGAIPCGEYRDNTAGKLSISWDEPVPVQVPIDNVTAVSAGTGVALVLRSDGTVWAWGQNIRGALGDGTTISTAHGELKPVRVAGLDNVKAISAGPSCLALRNDGTVWAWGANYLGELGDGTFTDSPVPKQVKDVSNVTMIGQTFAVRDDGTVWAWGMTWLTPDNSGHVETGTIDIERNVCKNVPVQVPGVDHVKVMASDSRDVTAYVSNDGSVWAWGYDGMLGNGNVVSSAPRYVNTPVMIKNLDNVLTVSADAGYVLALKNDGTVWAWGSNGANSLGNGKNIKEGNTYPTPTRISGLANVTAISAGGQNSIYLNGDGSVWVMGQNSDGQRGDGSTGGIIDPPVKVLGPGSPDTNTIGENPANNQSQTPPIQNVNNTTAQPDTDIKPTGAGSNPLQSNTWLGLGILILAIVIFAGGCLVYFRILRKM